MDSATTRNALNVVQSDLILTERQRAIQIRQTCEKARATQRSIHQFGIATKIRRLGRSTDVDLEIHNPGRNQFWKSCLDQFEIRLARDSQIERGRISKTDRSD